MSDTRISMKTVLEVQDKVNLSEVVEDYVALQGHCPFHAEDDYALRIYAKRKIFKCINCGEGGNVFGFIMKFEGIGFEEAVKLLAERSGINVKYKTEEGV